MSHSLPVRLLACALLALAAVGCDRSGGAQPAADKPVENPCDAFKARLCGQTANQFSTTCIEITTTIDLLTPDTCQLALDRVDHSLKILGGRDLSCDALQAKICADSNPTTKACEQVKRYMKRFPGEKCKEMLGRYPEVLAQVKQGLRLQ